MNLEDLLDENGLQQDEWSLTNPVFGKEDQLQVVGFFWNLSRSKKKKAYVLHCRVCEKDAELFGEGYFKTDKGDITRNMIPCGCSGKVTWSRDQYATICSRKATMLGYTFLGFDVNWMGKNTKLNLSCDKHGRWYSTSISNFTKPDGKRGCPSCARDKTEEGRRVPLQQRIDKITKLCEGTTSKLVSVPEDYKHVFQKIQMTCTVHGDWETTMKDVTDGGLCPKCSAKKRGLSRRIPDSEMIPKFMSTGAFSPGTTFTKKGWRENGKSEWEVFCPDCNNSGISTLDNLQQGKRPCACNNQRQQECYINYVMDGDNVVALKFGIAINSAFRVDSQNRSSVFEVVNKFVYTFPDTKSCKAAEKECKQILYCGVIPKEEMSDGYTETTYVYNLDKIIQIYKKHGGVKL